MDNSTGPNILTSGHLLARNTVINVVGQVIRMLVATAAIPFVIKGIGTGRFDILAIAWIVVGYFIGAGVRLFVGWLGI
ncbi:MAG: hypothetical protein J3T61_04095 [Candidatus Brocadiales bacterium]|nr:hypothetical protein [Candidatus Bathyanammoxibius sp.]